MQYNLFLDDLAENVRNPSIIDPNKEYVIALSFNEAINIMDIKGYAPEFISFDHDLGENEQTGYDLAHYLVNKDLDMNGSFLGSSFNFQVHSANPIGKANIEKLLHGYLSFKRSQKM